MNAPNLNHFVARLMVEELVRVGARDVGVAPGSRSSPLAEAAASHPALDMTVHPDERGMAYYMLGRAKGSRRPTVIITTSGTAAANLMPAVAEAHHAAVPLIVITADRPHELRECGANQATDQVKLFGSFVRWFFELPTPDDRMDPGFFLAAIDEAVRVATSHPRGPVHINSLFREPLAPVARPFPRQALERKLKGWRKSGLPWVRNVAAPDSAAVSPMRDVADFLGAQSQGLILAGNLEPTAARAVADLAAHLKWPLLPDLQSGLRLGVEEPAVVAHADLLLCSERFKRAAHAGPLLQFGSGFVTRRFLDCAAALRTAPRVLVEESPRRIDPAHASALRVVADPGAVARALREALPAGTDPSRIRAWSGASAKVERALATRFARDAWSEPGIAWLLSRTILPDHAWFVGNSLPIRMAATFASASGACIPFAASRGLSGIDGQVATAAGYAAGLGRPVTALLGDLTLLHDLNSLALLRAAHPPVTLVVVNNDGGGIFSLLPVADSSRHFERVFGTPHGLRFRAAAELFGLRYAAPESPTALLRAWRTAARSGESTLIEVRTRRTDTARAVRGLQTAIARMLDGRG